MRVLANDPCPQVEPGPGRVVLTTINHLNRDVWELNIVDRDGRSRTRPSHRLPQVLQRHPERLGLGQDASTRRGTQRRSRPGLRQLDHPVSGVFRVYNMTVEADHVYRVSTSWHSSAQSGLYSRPRTAWERLWKTGQPDGEPYTHDHNKWNGGTQQWEQSTVDRDEFGRQTGRTDWSDHGYPAEHSDPHHHKIEYSPEFPVGRETGPFPGPHPGHNYPSAP